MNVRRLSSVLVATLVGGCVDAGPAPTAVESHQVPVFAHAGNHGAKNFRTHLTGDEEVPANGSKAQGQATFQLNRDGTLDFKLIVANIEDVLMAHIHRAPAGSNGGVVVWLYPSGPPPVLIPGRSQGAIAEGTITDADVIGSLAGQGVAGLLAMIRAGNTYVNVHTAGIPSGEVRGQIN